MRTMNSQASASNSESGSFNLLDERIRRWIWESGWTELKDAQERAIPLILGAELDVIIAAATASGKTEAAFLPILTRLLQEQANRPCVLYVSPLKALINDQWERLERLCESLEVPVTPWHGDISNTKKGRFLKSPAGCLLITPESLEAMLMRQGTSVAGILRGLRYCVIDELHAFIGCERGKQLQSLLHRLEVVVKRRVPRIALSATIGEMGLAAEFLRPGHGAEVAVVQSNETSQELKVVVKGYVDLPPRLSEQDLAARGRQGLPAERDNGVAQGAIAISDSLFKSLRGSNNLVFPNSRAKVELYADLLRRRCEESGLPNEFWPHHGSLAKDIREETEAALKRKERPATAICTTTLELGIDIGAVKSVAQIGPAPSVASLRQRLGRSGRRRGEAATLRCYCLEAELQGNSSLSDQLREGLVQTVAQIRLLVKGWYEPPRVDGMHLSTLIQQLLSAIAQYGGLTAAQAWKLLGKSGVFAQLSPQDFAELLRALGEAEVLIQEPTGLLLHGPKGERLIGHYTFYAAFSSDEEFRLVTSGRALGTLPVSRPLEEGSFVIFAGRRWRVLSVDPEEKLIDVVPDKGGRPPQFDGQGGKVHDRVREEMRAVLAESGPVTFLDATAQQLLAEARDTYARLSLDVESVLQFGATVRIFLWRGDWVMDTLVLLLQHKGFQAANEGLCLAVSNADIGRLSDALFDIAHAPPLSASALAAPVENKVQEKWDWLLPTQLLSRNYASHSLDLNGALHAVQDVMKSPAFASYQTIG